MRRLPRPAKGGINMPMPKRNLQPTHKVVYVLDLGGNLRKGLKALVMNVFESRSE